MEHARRWLAVLAFAVTIFPASASAHTTSFPSTITIDYKRHAYFKGAVGSTSGPCLVDRKVQLFRDADPDVIVDTTYTNRLGNWFIERDYESATFYAKVTAKTISSEGHSHSCGAKKTSLLDFNLVTTSSPHGFTVDNGNCNSGTPQGGWGFVLGPANPPLGVGSLKLDAGGTVGPGLVSGMNFDGIQLATITEFSYGANMTNYTIPLGLLLYLDPDGAGPTGQKAYQYIPPGPDMNAVPTGTWHTWVVQDSHTIKEHPSGTPTTFGALKQAGALFRNDPLPATIAVVGACEQGPSMTSLNYLDRLVFETTAVRRIYDFEPSP